MNKKQLKQLAKKIADLEYTIQTSADRDEVNSAKDRMMQAQQAADLELSDMIALDELVQGYLKEKNICS